MRRYWTYILLVVTSILIGCESDANIDIQADRKTILYSFVEAGGECTIHAYQSISYAEKTGKMPLERGAKLSLTLNDTTQYRTELDGWRTNVKFGGLVIGEGSRIIVELEEEDKPMVYARSTVPSVPSVFLSGVEETEYNGKRYKVYSLRLLNEYSGENNYYKLQARDMGTGEVIDNVEYLDRIFEETQTGILNDREEKGLFAWKGETGRFVNLHCNVPIDDVKGEVVLELFHLTYEHFFYEQSLTILEDYTLLPVFSPNGLYSNVVNGIGLVTGVAKAEIRESDINE